MNNELINYVNKNNIVEFEVVKGDNFRITQSKDILVLNPKANLIDILENKKIEYIKISNNLIHIIKQPLTMRETFGYYDLLEILEILRSPEGCSWDKAQTHKSLRKNLIEETYELLEALNNSNIENIVEELGDYILQAVFHINIAEEQREFKELDVYTRLCKKLISRHTHIFGKDKAHTPSTAPEFWNKAKEVEKGTLSKTEKINKLCECLPSLMYAEKIIKIFEDELKVADELILKKNITENIEKKNTNFGELIFKIVMLSEHLHCSVEVELNKYVQTFIKVQIFKEILKNKFNTNLSIEQIKEIYKKEIYDLSIKDLIKLIENENWKPRT